MKLTELDTALSLKLGDPRTDNGDGALFPYEKRKDYLTRAYGRLVRMLRTVMREYAPSFAQARKILDYVPVEKFGGSALTITQNDAEIMLEKIDELYIVVTKRSSVSEDPKEVKTGNTIHYSGKATLISADRYLSVSNGENDNYDATNNYYYTILSNKIYLLPILDVEKLYYSKISLVYMEESPTFDNDAEVKIPREYIDLLLSLAAYEGMQDIARSDKVNLYSSDVSGQFQILSNYAEFKQRNKGSDING